MGIPVFSRVFQWYSGSELADYQQYFQRKKFKDNLQINGSYKTSPVPILWHNISKSINENNHKYSDALTLFHTCPKISKSPFQTVMSNQSTVGAGGLGIRRPRGFKAPQIWNNTKSVNANMMNISTESLSLIEDMVSEVIILRNSFYFPWQSVKINPYCW